MYYMYSEYIVIYPKKFTITYFLRSFLFCLQIKRDLANGTLQCNDNTAALMASYIVQGKNEILYKIRFRVINLKLELIC